MTGVQTCALPIFVSAEEAGVLRADMIAGMAESEDFTEIQRKISAKALAIGGFSLVETITRSTATAAGLHWARFGMKHVEANPKSRTSLIFKAKLQKYGVSLEKLQEQGLDGAEAHKLMRTAARVTQFSYDMRQVPLWMESPGAKFFFQFQKFGVQMARHVTDEILKPAFVGYQIEGQTVRDFKPLLMWAAFTVGTGEALMWLREWLFGKRRGDASFEMIGKAAMEGDFLTAGKWAWERIFHDAIYAGGFGLVGDYMSAMEDLYLRQKTRTPFNPPGIGPLINIWDNLVMRGLQQKKLTGRDFMDFTMGELPGLMYSLSGIKEIARKVGGENALGWRAAQLQVAKQDAREIRLLGYRWAKEEGHDRPPVGGTYSRTPSSPTYDAIQEALLIGDLQSVERLKNDFIEASGDEKKAISKLKGSIKSRMPLKVGGYDKDTAEADFEVWVMKRTPSKIGMVQEMDDRYKSTAQQAGLW